MEDRTTLLRLSLCVAAAILFTFARFVWVGGNPYNRIGYAFTMSLIPAILLLLLTRRSRRLLSWPQITGAYVLLFSLTIFIQTFARKL